MTNEDWYGMLPPDTTEEIRIRESGDPDGPERPGPVALLPVGSYEQHGPFLPLATDTLVACAVASAVAGAARGRPRARGLRLLPPLTVSCSHEHAAWPGTVSVSAVTLYAMVSDIAASLRAQGVGALVLVNGHGGNYVLGNAVQESAAAGRPMALFPAPEDWDGARERAGLGSTSYEDMHAGELETSVLLHTHPGLVRPGYQDADVVADDRRRLLTLGVSAYTASGVVGRPSLASAEKGAAVLASLVESFDGCLAALGSGGGA
jgi:creatinine amidohydrolase